MHWIALRPCSEPTDPQAITWWALRFSPRVARVEDAWLLEVSASERLFGGRQALRQRLLASNPALPPVQWSYGTTSLVALGRLWQGALTPGPVPRTPARALPLHGLAAARPHIPTLARLGCRNWGDLQALPRAGLVRRFGQALVAALDQAAGHWPDAYPWLSLPEAFDQSLELPARVESALALMDGVELLLARLWAWLAARQQGLVRLCLTWRLDLRRSDQHTPADGHLQVGTAQPTRDLAHVRRLVAEHLAHVSLPAPVLHLGLRAEHTAPMPGDTPSLLPQALCPGEPLPLILERLSARLGAARVLAAVPGNDHRPEHRQAWQPAQETLKFVANNYHLTVACAQKSTQSESVYDQLTPSWLLAQPLRLLLRGHRPWYHGALSLIAGPQRLESGWWEAPNPAQPGAPRATLRDYFVASSPQAGLVWVFRERLPAAARDPVLGPDGTRPAQDEPEAAWYLHGLFA